MTTPSNQETRETARRVFDAALAETGDVRHASEIAGVAVKIGILWQDELAATRFLEQTPGEPAAPAPSVTSFEGRGEDVAELHDYFDGGARLVTLVGPPGVGKTRLAQEWARMARPLLLRREPPVFCDLRGSHTRAALCAELAKQLRVCLEDTATSAEDALGDILAAIGMRLVVLDNFDDLAGEGAEVVAQWLEQTQHVRFLVTSRRLLRLRDELVFELGPLLQVEILGSRSHDAICDPQGHGNLDEEFKVLRFEDPAVRLFWARAQAAEPALRRQNPPIEEIDEVVRRLDGLPLAIELAAVQMRRTSVRGLLEELRTRTHSVVGKLDEVDPECRALATTIERSFCILSPEEKTAFARFGVFRNGFTLEAAAAVLKDGDLSSALTLERIVALREASLLSVGNDSLGGRRWDMFESLREFALCRLSEAGEAAEVRNRHAAFYLREGERWASLLRTDKGLEARAALRADLANLQTAFEWLVAQRPRRGAPLARMSLVMHHAYRHWMPTMSIRVATVALDDVAAQGASPETSVQLFLARASMRRETGDHQGAASDLFEGKARIEELRDALPAVKVSSLLAETGYEEGRLHFYRGRVKRARDALKEALTHAIEARAFHAEGRIRSALGIVLVEAFSSEAGFEHHTKAIALFDRIGDTIEESVARYWWIVDRLRFGHSCSTEELRAQAATMRRLGLSFHEAHYYVALCVHHVDVGDPKTAVQYANRVERLGRRLGLGRLRACAAFGLGLVADEAGDPDGAALHYERAIAGHSAGGDLRLEVLARIHLGGAAARAGRMSQARDLFREAEAMLGGCRDARLHELVDLQEAYVDLASAREASAAEDYSSARHFRQRARERVSSARSVGRGSNAARRPLATCCFEARCTLRILDRELDAVREDEVELRVAPDGSAFRVGTGPIHRLPDGPVIRQALLALVEHRLESTVEPLPTSELIRRCWRGERMKPRAGQMRVRAVIRRLRRAGLEELILTCEKGGYRLDPAVPVAWIPAARDS